MNLEKALEKNDAELVLECRKGSEAAFTELVRRYKEKAVRLACMTVGNYEDARDISQEAFVKVYRSLGRFEMQSQFFTWFYRILMNTAKDFMRRKQWRQFLSWEDREAMENFFEKVPDRGASPRKGILDAELGHRMTHAVQKLPFKQQWIFTLRFVEGFSIREIAQTTGLAEGTVKAALHFAVQKFRKEILPYVQKGGSDYGF